MWIFLRSIWALCLVNVKDLENQLRVSWGLYAILHCLKSKTCRNLMTHEVPKKRWLGHEEEQFSLQACFYFGIRCMFFSMDWFEENIHIPLFLPRRAGHSGRFPFNQFSVRKQTLKRPFNKNIDVSHISRVPASSFNATDHISTVSYIKWTLLAFPKVYQSQS